MFQTHYSFVQKKGEDVCKLKFNRFKMNNIGVFNSKRLSFCCCLFGGIEHLF